MKSCWPYCIAVSPHSRRKIPCQRNASRTALPLGAENRIWNFGQSGVPGPYGELQDRIYEDMAAGRTSSWWVPTPSSIRAVWRTSPPRFWISWAWPVLRRWTGRALSTDKGKQRKKQASLFSRRSPGNLPAYSGRKGGEGHHVLRHRCGRLRRVQQDPRQMAPRSRI